LFARQRAEFSTRYERSPEGGRFCFERRFRQERALRLMQRLDERLALGGEGD
jgi:hypothetical protein